MYYNLTTFRIFSFQSKPPLYQSLNLRNVMIETCIRYLMLHLPNFDDGPHVQFPCFFKPKREVSSTQFSERRKQPISIVVAVGHKIISKKPKLLRKGDLVYRRRDWSKLLNGERNRFFHVPFDRESKNRCPFFNRH